MMKIDRTKISDIGLVVMALIEQQKHGQLCPIILDALNEIAEEQLKQNNNTTQKEVKSNE